MITREQAASRIAEGWILEYCTGIRHDGWWWVRRQPGSSVTERVRGGTARSLIKTMKLVRGGGDWRAWHWKMEAKP